VARVAAARMMRAGMEESIFMMGTREGVVRFDLRA